MRITESTKYSDLLYNIQQNAAKLQLYQDQLSTGKQINTVSDDPAGAVNVLNIQETLNLNDQYNKNVNDGLNWLKMSDSAMNQMEQGLQRAQTLALEGGNGTLSLSQQQDLGAEVDQLINSAVGLANTQYEGQYIFGGTKTTIQPFQPSPPTGSATSVTFAGSTNQVIREVSPNTQQAVNVDASTVFPAYFNALIQLRDDLNTGNQAGIQADVGQLDGVHQNLLSLRASAGAGINRLQLTQDAINAAQTNFTKLLSDTQDINIEDVFTKLNVAQVVYQSSLQMAASIEQKSLLDFLR